LRGRKFMPVYDLMLKSEPSEETMAERRTKAYIARYAERVSPTKAIRHKCLECMGGSCEGERLPRGNADAVRAVDECSATHCPLWPFRFGKNIWTNDKNAANSNAKEAADLKEAA
jgi:hypothetical protein